MQAPKKDWSCQYQFATRYVKLPGGDALRLIDLIEDPPGRSHVGGAGVRYRHLAGRSDQKLGAKVGLKLTHLPADGCERYAEIATCSRKASPIDHPQEDRHGFEAVHDYSMGRELYSQ